MTTGLFVDLYHLDAAYVSWRTGENAPATFDLYTRAAPFGGAYLLTAGLAPALDFVRDFRYTDEDLAYLARIKSYDPAFLDELRRFCFSGEILAMPEGTIAFADEPLLRAQIGLEVEPDASAVETLIQACGPCHNNALNPNISRASFSIDLAQMDKAEINAAIERIELPPTAAGAMPPQRARALTPSVRARLLDYLRSRAEPDPQLAQAADAAMLGGKRPRR